MENNQLTDIEITTEEQGKIDIVKEHRNSKFSVVRGALVMLLVFTFICGIIYPLTVTIAGRAIFPYQANGSIIEVTLKDGSKRVYGSEHIGQNFENPCYMFGRVNTGAPSNLSPESEEFHELLKERVALRKEKLLAVGYTDKEDIPDELLTSGGSGVDPHISPSTAYFQVDAIIAGRKAEGWMLLKSENSLVPLKLTEEERVNYPLKDGESLIDYTPEFVKEIIDKYTEGRFLGVFGEKRVNVLLVNLALDGLL